MKFAKVLLLPVLAMFILSSNAAEPVEFEVGGIKFERPEGWGWVVPSSQMRKAQLTPPNGDGKDACEVTFFYFGPDQGGTVEQNIQRWVAQFSGGADALQKTETYGTTRVSFVTAEGTFNSGMPGGPTTPMDGYSLMGAILEGPQGNVFVKMTGPKSVIDPAKPAFETMIEAAGNSIQ